MDHLEGIAEADARLGRRFPLPDVVLPLARWVEIRAIGDGVEVEWNLDDSRPGAPGRLALYAGPTDPGSQLAIGAVSEALPEAGWTLRTDALDKAQESLRPVVEIAWHQDELHLRLTAQGPWELEALLAMARAIVV